jgi:hypothetical protein
MAKGLYGKLLLGTRVSRSYCSGITVARHCSCRGIFGRKGFILARVFH